MAVRGIGVGFRACARAFHLLEHQHVAGPQAQARGCVVPQRGPRGAGGQAAVVVAPGVEAEPVVGGVQRQVVEQLEDLGPVLRHHLPVRVLVDQRGVARDAGEQPRWLARQVLPRQHHVADAGRGLERHPRTGVHAVVHRVVQQPRVPVDRRPPARAAQVRLGGYRVLAVAQPVGGVGQHLHHCHAHVRRASLLPLRHDYRQPVQHQPAEALVVPGQVVDGRCRARLGRADLLRRAVEVRRALHLEGELHLGQRRVEGGEGRVAVHEPEAVGGVVAALLRADHQQVARHRLVPLEEQVVLGGGDEAVGQHRVGVGRPVGPRHLDGSHAHAAVDGHVVRGERHAGVQRLHQLDEQRLLARAAHRRLQVQDLEVVDAVEGGVLPHRPETPLLPAPVLRGHAQLPSVMLRPSPLRRMLRPASRTVRPAPAACAVRGSGPAPATSTPGSPPPPRSPR